MSKYDVIVVGAGPAGLFACYELLKSHKDMKIALIDMGNRIENRKPSEVMSGIGGAGTFSDGKLHLTAYLSHEKAFHLISQPEYQKILDYVDEIFTDFGVDAEYYPKLTPDYDKLIEDATKNDVELIVRKARHVGTDKLTAVIAKMEKDLLKKGVEILDNTEVIDILVKDKKISGIITKDKKEIKAPIVLLAPGRVRASWLQKLANKYDIKYMYDKVEVGVRVEF